MAHTAVGAFSLTCVTDFVATSGTAAEMFGAGALPTRPAGAPATFAVFGAAHRADLHPAFRAQNVAAVITLAQAAIAHDVAVATEGNCVHLLPAGVAGRATQRAVVAIQAHP